MLSLHDRIRALPKETGLVLKHACQSVGVSYGTLHAQLQNQRAIPFETVEKLAVAFDVPLTYFASARGAFSICDDAAPEQRDPKQRASKQRDMGSRVALARIKEAETKALKQGLVPGIDMVLDWLDRENGVLRNFEFIKDRFELFEPTEEGAEALRLHSMGRKSLASVYFNVTNEQEFRERMQNFSSKLHGQLIASHAEVTRSKRYRIDDMDIEVPMDGLKLSARYRRLIAPVRTEEGRPLNLVFARLIRAPRYAKD